MTHEDIEGLVPLLALDALSPPEELHVRTHLETCPACASLLREHLETAADLALLAPPAALPPGLKSRLMAEIANEPQVVPAARHLPGPRARSASSPRRAPLGRWQRTMAGLAAACLLLGAVNFVIARRLARQDEQIAQQRQILQLISGKPAMTMAATDKGAGATGHVFIKDGRSAVVLTGLGDPGKGVYELWGLKAGKPVPLKEVTNPDWQDKQGQAVVLIDESLSSYEGVALSLEPSEGSTTPRGPILLSS